MICAFTICGETRKENILLVDHRKVIFDSCEKCDYYIEHRCINKVFKMYSELLDVKPHGLALMKETLYE